MSAPTRLAPDTVDTYVIESIDHLREAGLGPADFAARYALLLLKPDAIVARGVDITLDWLQDNGYRVVYAERVHADRHVSRAMWRTSWLTASAQRRRLADLLVGICDALVLVITRDDTDPGEAVTVRLTREKGPTDPRRRVAGELRHALGINSYLLNLVHTPDEPVDVLREFSILFDEPTRARCLAALTQPGADGAVPTPRALGRALYAEVPARSFTLTDAVERLRADLAAAGVAVPAEDEPAPDAAAALIDAARTAGVATDPWSTIVAGSHVLPLTAEPITEI